MIVIAPVGSTSEGRPKWYRRPQPVIAASRPKLAKILPLKGPNGWSNQLGISSGWVVRIIVEYGKADDREPHAPGRQSLAMAHSDVVSRPFRVGFRLFARHIGEHAM
jgi:hypothetical protein